MLRVAVNEPDVVIDLVILVDCVGDPEIEGLREKDWVLVSDCDLVPVALTVSEPEGEDACDAVTLGVGALEDVLLRVIPPVKLGV